MHTVDIKEEKFISSYLTPFVTHFFYIRRYKNLNNAVVTRGKVLHAAVHSLQSFDKSLDQVSNV